MKMRQGLLAVCGSVALCVGLVLAGCGSQGNTNVRVVNASPELANFTVQVGVIGIVSSLPYAMVGVQLQGTYGSADTSGVYRAVGAGANQKIIVFGQTSSDILTSQTQTLLKNGNYTIVLFGTPPGIGEVVLTDNDIAPQSGDYRLRVAHFSQDSGAVDVYLTAPGSSPSGATPVLSDFQWGQVTQTYFELKPGAYEIQITPHGNPSTVLMKAAFTPVAGDIYTAFALDPPAGGAGKFGILVTNDPVSPTAAPSSM